MPGFKDGSKTDIKPPIEERIDGGVRILMTPDV